MKNYHTIQRIDLSIKFLEEEKVGVLEQRIRELANSLLPEIIESIINKINFPIDIVYIERIELDLGRIKSSNLENDFIESFINEFEKSLQNIVIKPSTSIKFKDVKGSQQEAIEIFLSTGSFPWWAGIDPKTSFENIINEFFLTPAAFQSFILRLKNKQQVDRIINQLRIDDLQKFVFGLNFKGNQILFNGIKYYFTFLEAGLALNKFKQLKKEIFRTILYEYILSTDKKLDSKFLEKLIKEPLSQTIVRKSEKEKIIEFSRLFDYERIPVKEIHDLMLKTFSVDRNAKSSLEQIGDDQVEDTEIDFPFIEPEKPSLSVDIVHEGFRINDQLINLLDSISGIEPDTVDYQKLAFILHVLSDDFPIQQDAYRQVSSRDIITWIQELIKKHPDVKSKLLTEFIAKKSGKEVGYRKISGFSDLVLKQLYPEIFRLADFLSVKLSSLKVFEEVSFSEFELMIVQTIIEDIKRDSRHIDQIEKLWITKSMWLKELEKLLKPYLDFYEDRSSDQKIKILQVVSVELIKVLLSSKSVSQFPGNDKLESVIQKYYSESEKDTLLNETIFDQFFEFKQKQLEELLTQEEIVVAKEMKDQKAAKDFEEQFVKEFTETIDHEEGAVLARLETDEEESVQEADDLSSYDVYFILPFGFYKQLLNYVLAYKDFPWWSGRIITEIMKTEKLSYKALSKEKLIELIIKGTSKYHPDLVAEFLLEFAKDKEQLKQFVFLAESDFTFFITKLLLPNEKKILAEIAKEITKKTDDISQITVPAAFFLRAVNYFLLSNLESFSKAGFTESIIGLLDYIQFLSGIREPDFPEFVLSILADSNLSEDDKVRVGDIIKDIQTDEVKELISEENYLLFYDKLYKEDFGISKVNLNLVSVLKMLIQQKSIDESMVFLPKSYFEKQLSLFLKEKTFFAQQLLPDILKFKSSRIVFAKWFSKEIVDLTVEILSKEEDFIRIQEILQKVQNFLEVLLTDLFDKKTLLLTEDIKIITAKVLDIVIEEKGVFLSDKEIVQLLYSQIRHILSKKEIEKIAIHDIGKDILLQYFEESFSELLTQEMRSELLGKILESEKVIVSSIQEERAAFLSSNEFLINYLDYYIRFGSIPWWVDKTISTKEIADLLKSLIQSGKITSIPKIKYWFNNSQLLVRLVAKFNDGFILTLLQFAYFKEDKQFYSYIEILLKSLKKQLSINEFDRNDLVLIINWLISQKQQLDTLDIKYAVKSLLSFFSERYLLKSSDTIKEVKEISKEPNVKKDQTETELSSPFIAVLDEIRIDELKQEIILARTKQFTSSLQIEVEGIIESIVMDIMETLTIDELKYKPHFRWRFHYLRAIHKFSIEDIFEKIKTYIEQAKITVSLSFNQISDLLYNKSFLHTLFEKDVKTYVKHKISTVDQIDQIQSDRQLQKLIKQQVISLNSSEEVIKESIKNIQDLKEKELSVSKKSGKDDEQTLKQFTLIQKDLDEAYQRFIDVYTSISGLKEFLDLKDIDFRKKFAVLLIEILATSSILSIQDETTETKTPSQNDTLEEFKTKEKITLDSIDDLENEIADQIKASLKYRILIEEVKSISESMPELFDIKIKEHLSAIFSEIEKNHKEQIDFIILSLFEEKELADWILRYADKQELTILSETIMMPLESVDKHTFIKKYVAFFKRLFADSKAIISITDSFVEKELLRLILQKPFKKRIDADFILESIQIILDKLFLSIKLNKKQFEQISIEQIKKAVSQFLEAVPKEIAGKEWIQVVQDRIVNYINQIIKSSITIEQTGKSKLPGVDQEEPVVKQAKREEQPFPGIKEIADDDEFLKSVSGMTENELYEKIAKSRYDWLDKQQKQDKYYIQNAGLVIVHPFLKHLFKNLELLDEKNNFKGFAEQEKAVHLTQYIATGEEFPPEHLLVLNKILCGMDVSFPIRRDVELTVKEKKECDVLMESVIKHWEVVKNSSIKSIRETFILREGVLVFKQENWSLKVEQKGFDILIEKIPWTISTVKFPWTEYLIFVEWT
jgi:hypothetical protein